MSLEVVLIMYMSLEAHVFHNWFLKNSINNYTHLSTIGIGQEEPTWDLQFHMSKNDYPMNNLATYYSTTLWKHCVHPMCNEPKYRI